MARPVTSASSGSSRSQGGRGKADVCLSAGDIFLLETAGKISWMGYGLVKKGFSKVRRQKGKDDGWGILCQNGCGSVAISSYSICDSQSFVFPSEDIDK